MRKATSVLVLASIAALPIALAARAPNVNTLDARARALGNLKPIAVAIGQHLFQTTWPAQILSVRVDGIGKHAVAGLSLSGVKFHRPLKRSQFITEVLTVVRTAFAASSVEEVDLWCTVPLWVGKGAIVSGDLAVPTSRTVFALTVRRSESARGLWARLRDGGDVFWDKHWERKALRPG